MSLRAKQIRFACYFGYPCHRFRIPGSAVGLLAVRCSAAALYVILFQLRGSYCFYEADRSVFGSAGVCACIRFINLLKPSGNFTYD
jgi:hypothetical protein